ncbi:hypothetical protein C7M84_025386 [Penaeus vannamei]|uniref:Uncharacterized protein n=1 Tax=Penaeus vannamei TaxID=6689 RepID=A0A423TYE6_PENVA|nr:hypothetical protein C7M84_025386 [Penaeus vannamei]
MAKYGAKRRPLSCEMNLSVIQEEVLDNLRQRGPARGQPRLKRRSLSAWDAAAEHALLSFVDRQATAGDGGDGGEDFAEGGLSEGEEFSSDEGDDAETGVSASSGPPASGGAFAAPPEGTPEHVGLVPLLRTMSKTSLDNFEIDSTGRVVASRPRAARAQSVDLSAQKKGRRGSGVLAAFWKRTSNIMRRGFLEVDLASSLELAETPPLLDRRSSYASNESLPGAYRISPDTESSPFPVSRRGVNGLRQCDSLENVCDSSHEDQIENGLGE